MDKKVYKSIRVKGETHQLLRGRADQLGVSIDDALLGLLGNDKREPETSRPDSGVVGEGRSGATPFTVEQMDFLIDNFMGKQEVWSPTATLAELKFDDMEEPGWKVARRMAEVDLPKERAEKLEFCQDPEERDRIEKEYDTLIQMYWNRYHESKPQEGGSDEQ